MRHRLEAPLLGTLRGIHRNSWVSNQDAFRRALPVLELLDRAGVETALLKGAALVRWAYADAGTRAMRDVDIVVRAEQGTQALQALGAESWKGRRLATAGERPRRLVGSTSIRHPEREVAFRVHFRPIADAFGDDAPFWASMVESEFQGRRVRLLSRAHELAVALAHGSRIHRDPTPKWVMDTVHAVRAGEIEWDELVELAERERLSLRFAHSLAYVERTFGGGVPRAVLDHLGAIDAPPFEREELDTLLELDGRFDARALHRLYYRRASAAWSPPVRAAGYPLYVGGVEGVRLLDALGRLRTSSR